ncbi:FAD-dependent monooxygenase [Methylotenera sp.]|uniref:FAD-dependent monooxygenase n=1 Tax=Methylotenera sp. TaxID=2051956 RepID=UPI0027306FB6|nr:FAD-dependent monooxygenase [Methylotenera sp.]MDP2230128.1 FAD-dependent monooxygenase [Methylotenera sp.]MDP3142256.1 FAD-dependent monooxygenase [Methylotenera sp.]
MSEPVIIVGGGPVGATLALLLAKQGIATTVLEARKQGAAYSESRALALSYGSKRILEKLGVWAGLVQYATAINTIHVSQKGSLGRSLLRANDYKQEALGYVLSYGALSAALDDALAKESVVNFIFEASAEAIEHTSTHSSVTYLHNNKSDILNCQLVVLADGGRSLDEIAGLTKQTKEYGHDALISSVSAELPHNNVAYERFTANGPMALLPNGERNFSLVWTGKKEYVASLLTLNDAEFLAQFHAEFGDRVGRFLSVEKRMAFPLKLSQLKTTDTPHLAVIGNAAQTMHPVAGQGFNVGLRDAEFLAKFIASATPDTLGSNQMLADYRTSRQSDTKNGLLFTDFLVNIFSNDIVGVSGLRSVGLGLFDLIKPVKQHLIRKMSFGK